ncbi:MAG: hypothetical protein ACOCRO_01425 [Halanaerobiales bacterium]
MNKEEEIMKFLESRVFDPVLNSSDASRKLKSGVNLTIARLKQRNAQGMISYFWSAICGTEKSIGFSGDLKREGFTRFEDVLEEFRSRFNDSWLNN